MLDDQGQNISIYENGIANKYEKEKFYKRFVNYTEVQWMDVENEHFIVWMAMETYNKFRKLWGIIKQDLRPNNYTIIVEDSILINIRL
jgi:hypothetical protein